MSVNVTIDVIIAASGSGLRLGGDIPKQFQYIDDMPVIAHTTQAFNRLDITREIIIAVPPDYVSHTNEIVTNHRLTKVNKIIPGGINRASSVYLALSQLSPDSQVVLIHDGVRPFVSEDIITAVANSAKINNAAVAGIPLIDTIKKVDTGGQVIKTPDRSQFWRVQTPQGFTYELILKAYTQGQKDNILAQVTDDSALVERLGIPVQMVKGNPLNIKITTPEDLILCEMLLKQVKQNRT